MDQDNKDVFFNGRAADYRVDYQADRRIWTVSNLNLLNGDAPWMELASDVSRLVFADSLRLLRQTSTSEEVRVNTLTAGDQLNAEVIRLQGGGSVVTWQS